MTRTACYRRLRGCIEHAQPRAGVKRWFVVLHGLTTSVRPTLDMKPLRRPRANPVRS